ncbi:lipase 3 precursor [Beauveria brongniartii RCEF 3172]|uniref:Carboxylic ester hydrolase n=1 Tax=Beauveria brongniartii RCEF 3172 TaxID=1081107 RepID=A0A168DZG9_9HYPO|nr:lipase 3 precursor [Beauveria brongniartii RCEF 3172]
MGQNQPFIYVTANYRLSAFGFMPGKEILQEGSSNAGVLDQRMALEWVADNIQAFGGDPKKVTIWGESAGSASVMSQMLLYGGNATYKSKPLFRGGIMDSGTIFPSDPIDCSKGQALYDQIARDTGCSGAQDTLEYLRQVDYNVLCKVVSTFPQIRSYHGPGLVFHPRPDGNVLVDSPEVQIRKGQFFAVPIIVGHQEDEGTLLGLFQKNVTTPADMANYLHQTLFSHAPLDKLREVVDMYEPALVQGSPYRTGPLNELYPGFKRVAATVGDLAFILTRRVTLEYFTKVKPKVPVWSYQASYFHGLSILGTFHTSDLVQVFYRIPVNYAMKSSRTYCFNFLYNLDPDSGVGGFARWPDWRENQQLMWFETPSRNSIIKDDFRKNASDWLGQNMDVLRT